MGKRFVIQEHTRGGKVHWDVMLESGDILKTWRIDTSPDRIGNEMVSAMKISDHDLKFLTYEGSVNKGLGSIRIVDNGTFEMLEESETKLHINFQGKILFGKFLLNHIDHDQWRLFKPL